MEFGNGQITLFVLIIFIVLCCMFTCFYRIYEVFKKKRSSDPQVEAGTNFSQDLINSKYNENLRLLKGQTDEKRLSQQTNRISIDESYCTLLKGGRPDIFINDDTNNLRSSIDTFDKSINSGQRISLLSIDSQRSSRSSSTLLIPNSPRAQTSHSLSLRPSESSILPLVQAGNLTFSIHLNKKESILSINIMKCTDLSTANIIRRHSATPDYNTKRNSTAHLSLQSNGSPGGNQSIIETYIILMFAPENEEIISYRLEKAKNCDGTSEYNTIINFPSMNYEKVFNTSLFFIVRGLVRGNHLSLMHKTTSVFHQLSDHTVSILLGSVNFGKIGYSVSLSDNKQDANIQTVPLINANDNLSFSRQLDSFSNSLPQLMLSIIYNPDEKNISVTIVKAKRLAKPVFPNFIPNHVSTFVNIEVIVYGVKNNSSRNSLVSELYSTERNTTPLNVLLKKRTQVRPKTRYPKYNETFNFTQPNRMPIELLPSSLVLEAEIFYINESSPSMNHEKPEAISLGRVVLGQQSTIHSPTGRYWWKVFKNPGKTFNEWHELV